MLLVLFKSKKYLKNFQTIVVVNETIIQYTISTSSTTMTFKQNHNYFLRAIFISYLFFLITHI